MKKYIIPVLFFMCLIVTSVCYFLVPDKEISVEENRTLARMPEFNAETVFSGEYTSGMNSYMSDQFPFRNEFIETGDKINDILHLESKYKIHMNNNTAIIIDDNRAVELYPIGYNEISKYASMLNTYSDILRDVNVFSMIVPTASEFYLNDNFKNSDNRYSQKYAIDTLYSMTVPDVIKVDAYKNLKSAASVEGNYIYYRTDHHWTGKGAYEGYAAFCKAANLEVVPLEKLTHASVKEDFLGSFYRLTKDDALLDFKDSVDYYVPPKVKWDATAYLDAEMTNSYDTDLFVVPLKEQDNKYSVFLNGDHPLAKITTENVYSTKDEGRNLLLIKDSYGNAFAPYLVSHYKNIYILDPRYLTLNLKEFCKNNKIDDLIVETYAFSLTTEYISELLLKLVE